MELVSSNAQSCFLIGLGFLVQMQPCFLLLVELLGPVDVLACRSKMVFRFLSLWKYLISTLASEELLLALGSSSYLAQCWQSRLSMFRLENDLALQSGTSQSAISKIITKLEVGLCAVRLTSNCNKDKHIFHKYRCYCFKIN